MADENLKDFSVNWVLAGLLFFCLISFALGFIYYNNPDALGDSQGVFENSQSSFQGRLVSITNQTDSLLNITAKTNPEESQLGSRDSVAVSYGITGSSKGFFESFKIFMSWVLQGTSGQIIIGVFGGLFGLLALYFITKWIRQGF